MTQDGEKEKKWILDFVLGKLSNQLNYFSQFTDDAFAIIKCNYGMHHYRTACNTCVGGFGGGLYLRHLISWEVDNKKLKNSKKNQNGFWSSFFVNKCIYYFCIFFWGGGREKWMNNKCFKLIYSLLPVIHMKRKTSKIMFNLQKKMRKPLWIQTILE